MSKIEPTRIVSTDEEVRACLADDLKSAVEEPNRIERNAWVEDIYAVAQKFGVPTHEMNLLYEGAISEMTREKDGLSDGIRMDGVSPEGLPIQIWPPPIDAAKQLGVFVFKNVA